jgi:hypothetical protein
LGSEESLLKELTVVIPVGPGETAWKSLLPDLLTLSSPAEIILTGPQGPEDLPSFVQRFSGPGNLRWIFSEQGRGRQLNAGAFPQWLRLLWERTRG